MIRDTIMKEDRKVQTKYIYRYGVIHYWGAVGQDLNTRGGGRP